MAESGGLLAKSGLDSIKIGNHKVPIALLAGGVALVGVVAVLRARQSGQNVASVGQAPATAADTGFGATPLPGTDVGPALANISQQLTTLSQNQSQTDINGPATSPNPTPVADSMTLFGVIREANPGNQWDSLVGSGWGAIFGNVTGIPIWTSKGNQAAPVGLVPFGSQIQVTGPAGAYGVPVLLPGGTQGYVNPADLSGYQSVSTQSPLH